MGLFNYYAVQTPREVKVEAEITGIAPQEVKAKITSIESFTVILKSEDKGITKMIEDAVAFFCTLFKDIPYKKVNDAVVNKEQKFTLDQPIGYSLATVTGDPIRLVAKSLVLDTYQGMLMASGTVEIG